MLCPTAENLSNDSIVSIGNREHIHRTRNLALLPGSAYGTRNREARRLE